jgi:hypothetical protein
MNGMLISLLDINRLEAGILRPSVRDFSASELFDSLAADFLKPAREKGLEWRIVRSGLWLRTDRQMLEEMLRNLLSNAIRYTDQGRILVGCRRIANSARIQVWDSGVGIMREDIPKIFEEHSSSASNRAARRIWLGPRHRATVGENTRHRVDVISTPGKGSGFSIEVPLGPPDRSQKEMAQPRLPVSHCPERFLIEDEGGAAGIQLVFAIVRIDVIAVGTRRSGLHCVAGKIPDLIVSDYNLPGKMNGWRPSKLRKTRPRHSGHRGDWRHEKRNFGQ